MVSEMLRYLRLLAMIYGLGLPASEAFSIVALLWNEQQHGIPYCTTSKMWFQMQLEAVSGGIEFQSQHGRGDKHLSSLLDEGDVVVYQSGTWTVDGVEVGDGSDPEFHFCRMETLQIVWTHNCEHGVLRGYELDAIDGTTLSLTEEVVEFGPEQLVARIPAEWSNDQTQAISKVELNHVQWLADEE